METTEKQSLLHALRIGKENLVLVIGSTHDTEESALISALAPVFEKIPHLKVLLTPRHPERFLKVAKLLKKKKVPFSRYSEKNCHNPLILIDTMGLLNACYQIADVAIVCGSFTTKVGGHNIFEPVLYGVPVLFGPHMHSQIDLRDMILNAKAGQEVTIETLPQRLLELLQNPTLRAAYAQSCKNLSHLVQGATERTFEKSSILKKPYCALIARIIESEFRF